jgi:hypothetical protein
MPKIKTMAYFTLFCESDPSCNEIVHMISLCFRKPELEENYRAYQFELGSSCLNGRLGALSITSAISFANMTAFYLTQTLDSFKKFSDAALWRMILGLPITIFCLHHQFQIQTRSEKRSRQDCKDFVSQFVSWYTFTESAAMLLNDSYPEYEGCLAHRFRCPFTFSGAKFCARAVAYSALIIFHLTPCFSIVDIMLLVFVLCGASRILGLMIIQDHVATSLWSTSCTAVQIAILIGCRYVYEMHDRKCFLLQLQISRLRSNFQELLDSMMPCSVSQRLKTGQFVFDPCESGVVLVCSFPFDAHLQQNTMQVYTLIDRVHQAFDKLLAQNGVQARKVDFVGSDYLVISSTILDAKVTNTPNARDEAGCIAL